MKILKLNPNNLNNQSNSYYRIKSKSEPYTYKRHRF